MIKVALLGEYSALHLNLKKGLSRLGCNVTILSGGDGWKNIESDIDLSSNNKYIKYSKMLNESFLNKDRFYGFDVAQLINPIFIHNKGFIDCNKRIILNTRDSVDKMFLLSAGDDAVLWKNANRNLKYSNFESQRQIDLNGEMSIWENKKNIEWNNKVTNIVDGIIPIVKEYAIAYNGHEKLKDIIPLPIDFSNINFKKLQRKNKITFFHGLNRYGAKGTKYIREAFHFLEKKYPNDIKYIEKGGIPLSEYLKIMEETDVVVDQIFSYSLGMNALYAMAMGKLVLGGNEPESNENYLSSIINPTINITPDKDQIIAEVELLLEKKYQLPLLSQQSHDFVKINHCSNLIAERYIDAWGF